MLVTDSDGFICPSRKHLIPGHPLAGLPAHGRTCLLRQPADPVSETPPPPGVTTLPPLPPRAEVYTTAPPSRAAFNRRCSVARVTPIASAAARTLPYSS